MRAIEQGHPRLFRAVPGVLAVLLAFVLAPVVRVLRRIRMPRSAAFSVRACT